MRRFLWIPMVFTALLIPASVLAADSDAHGFNGVINSIEHQYHVRATRIPFLGLANFVARKSTHSGVSSMHIAEFENFATPVDGDTLNRMVEQKLGPDWERAIRDTSRWGNEQTLIFTRSEGQRMGMFVIDLDGNEMDVVQLSVDPKYLDDDIDQYSHSHRDYSN